MKPIPQRIVSLLPAATEMLSAVGAGDRLVGVSHECNWPPEVEGLPRLTRSNVDSAAPSGEIDRQVQTLMRHGSALYAIDAELLAELKPDLIVTQAQCDVCAVRYDDVAHAVRQDDSLRLVPIVALNPRSLADVLDELVMVGEAVGCQREAQRVREDCENRLAAVRLAVRPAASRHRPRTVVIEWLDPPMVAANWTPELVEMAGGRYELAEPGRHSGYASWGDVFSYDPEVLILAPCGFDLPRTIGEARPLAAIKRWPDMAAVRQERVFAADGDAYFNRPGPRLVDTVELLAALLHPSASSFSQYDSAVRRLRSDGSSLVPA